MITIIDYNAGNVASVANALKRLGVECKVSSDKSEVARAEKVIFPGVGAARAAMQKLYALDLVQAIRGLKVPFLGICLGMQILADYSEEGEVECLKILPGKVKKFSSPGLKVPQIGWNKVSFREGCRLSDGLSSAEYFYFVNSYYFEAADDICLGETSYGEEFCSVAQKDNFFATQFHPEKSGEVGLKLLDNFCKL